MEKEILEELILDINSKTNIKPEILEKDYYVCLVLKELSNMQNQLHAYFKGGTAVYKILNTMNRFSEDIDLTVKVNEQESNTSNRRRLKKSALGYNIDGLELVKDETIDKKGSITTFYKYDSLFSLNSLFKSEKIQIESTSFTVSEPTKKYKIEPLIYKYANKSQKEILKNTYNIRDFEIEIIKLERIFVDKIFATEFYYMRNQYEDASKHLYDITVLYNTNTIQNFLKDKEYLKKIIAYKRQEETNRIGGISNNLKIKDFSYFKLNFNQQLTTVYKRMQNIYVLEYKYKINIKTVKVTLNKIYKQLENIEEYTTT